MTEKKKLIQSMDGNEACAYAAYAFTEVAGIYRLHLLRQFHNSWIYGQARKENLFGMPVKVRNAIRSRAIARSTDLAVWIINNNIYSGKDYY